MERQPAQSLQDKSGPIKHWQPKKAARAHQPLRRIDARRSLEAELEEHHEARDGLSWHQRCSRAKGLRQKAKGDARDEIQSNDGRAVAIGASPGLAVGSVARDARKKRVKWVARSETHSKQRRMALTVLSKPHDARNNPTESALLRLHRVAIVHDCLQSFNERSAEFSGKPL
jgi:hypothetical protein